MADAPNPTAPPPNGATGPTTPAEPPKPSAAETDYQQRLASLQKEQRRINAERMAFKAEQEAFAKERDEMAKVRALLADAKKRPIDYLKAGGLTYEDLTNAQLNDGKPDAALLAKDAYSEVEKLRAEMREAESKRLEELRKAQEAQKQQARVEFRDEISDYVKANAEKFELCSLNDNSANVILAVIEDEFEKSGNAKLLTIEEGAAKVEAFLEQQARKLSAAKKLTAATQVSQPNSSGPLRSITNDMTASTQARSKPRSEREREAAALAALSK